MGCIISYHIRVVIIGSQLCWSFHFLAAWLCLSLCLFWVITVFWKIKYDNDGGVVVTVHDAVEISHVANKNQDFYYYECSVWLFVACQVCSASKAEHRLMSSLFDAHNYNRHVRPVIDHKKPVVVDVRLSLVEIIGLDENNGRLKLKLHLNMV